jgi:hypothetical protein
MVRITSLASESRSSKSLRSSYKRRLRLLELLGLFSIQFDLYLGKSSDDEGEKLLLFLEGGVLDFLNRRPDPSRFGDLRSLFRDDASRFDLFDGDDVYSVVVLEVESLMVCLYILSF